MPNIPDVNTRFHPANFYKHINNKWQSHVHIPPFHGNYGVSEEIEDDVRNHLLKLIEYLRDKHPRHAVSKLASSFLHTPSQHNSLFDLQRLLSRFECMNTPESIGENIGFMNKIQVRSPISIVISNDIYKSSEGRVFLYEPQLGLPEKQFYRKDASPKTVLPKYSKLLSTVGKLMNIESLESTIAIEQRILSSLSTYDERENLKFSYNPHTISELRAQYPAIPWNAIFSRWGLPESSLENTVFIITNKRYFSMLNKKFLQIPLEDWRTWMRSMVILSFLEYMPPPFDDLDFELYNKALDGNTQKLPQKYLTLKVLQKFAKQDLGKIFVENIVPKGTKSYARALIKDLIQSTVDRLNNIKWMKPETKQKAIQKVRQMKFQVAYPEQWHSETKGLPITEDRPLQNIIMLSSKDTEQMIHELKTNKIAKTEEKWDDGVFEVNAYYYSEGNMMVIPAGILQTPFFDLKRSLAWNYGGIGSAIGHEITHGFDVDGRMYDLKGDYNNWWTEEDSKQYTIITKALVKLFDGQEYMGGEVDGKLTLSENMADLGGLSIALHALQTKMKSKTEKDKKEAYRDFFTSYAVSWRNKDRQAKAKHSLSQDEHAPPPLRVNLIVRQFEEFYIAFDIKPDDPDYIALKDRIVMW